MNKRSIYMTQNRPRFESGGFQLFGRIGTATALRGVVYFNSTGRKRKYETKSDPAINIAGTIESENRYCVIGNRTLYISTKYLLM